MNKTLSPDQIRAKFIPILCDSRITDADYYNILSKYFSYQSGLLDDVLENATEDELNRINNDYDEFPHKLLLTDEPACRSVIQCTKPPMSLKEISEFVTKMRNNPLAKFEINALCNGGAADGWIRADEYDRYYFNFEVLEYRIVETE